MTTKMFHQPELKLRGDGNGFLEGYASTWSNWDLVGERPVKGAFAASLDAFLRDGFVGVQHDWGVLPVATPLEAREDDLGLFVAAEFHSTDDAQKARTVIRERIERNKSVKLSIGYDVLEDEFVEEGRLLKKIDLLEWSYVLYPANTLAVVTTVKGAPESGLPFDDHIRHVVSTVEALVDRTKSRIAAREKAGRRLSAATVQEMETGIDSIQTGIVALKTLLASATPEKSIASELLRLRSVSNALRRQAQELGVSL